MAQPIRTALRASSGLSSSPASLRRLSSFSPAKAQVQPVAQPTTDHIPPPEALQHDVAAGRPSPLSRTYFDATGVRWVGAGKDEPQDPNKAKLGRSMFHP
ncbi:hypothetical protein G7046_g8754 [Stylonectria norvegica]|nr:hypothetical protein G7046_g8754 [Stylonectria norvegica]